MCTLVRIFGVIVNHQVWSAYCLPGSLCMAQFVGFCQVYCCRLLEGSVEVTVSFMVINAYFSHLVVFSGCSHLRFCLPFFSSFFFLPVIFFSLLCSALFLPSHRVSWGFSFRQHSSTVALLLNSVQYLLDAWMLVFEICIMFYLQFSLHMRC